MSLEQIPPLRNLSEIYDSPDYSNDNLSNFEQAFLLIMRETDRSAGGYHGADVIEGINEMINLCNSRRRKINNGS